VKLGRRITAGIIVLCVVLGNTGILHAVHLQACTSSWAVSDRDGPSWMPHTDGGHDPHTCALCVHAVATKKILSGPADSVVFAVELMEKTPQFITSPLRSVLLFSASPRAPPLVS
jgi:hypothetical protein